MINPSGSGANNQFSSVVMSKCVIAE